MRTQNLIVNSFIPYSFNGMEKDNEVKGEGNSYNFGARMLDARVGRWLSIDPLADKFPAFCPYNFVLNSTLVFIDPDGKDVIVAFTGGSAQGNKTDNASNTAVSTTDKVVAHAKQVAEKNNVEMDGVVVKSGISSRKASRVAYKFIKENLGEGEKLIIYGYSFGGKHALKTIEKLEKKGVDVQLLLTVDPTNGLLGANRNLGIDFNINPNVSKAINYFQTTREKGTGSLGGLIEGPVAENIEVKQSETSKSLEKNQPHQTVDEDAFDAVTEKITQEIENR